MSFNAVTPIPLFRFALVSTMAMVLLAVMSLPAHAWSHGSLTFTGYSSGNGSGTHACTTITKSAAGKNQVE